MENTLGDLSKDIKAAGCESISKCIKPSYGYLRSAIKKEGLHIQLNTGKEVLKTN